MRAGSVREASDAPARSAWSDRVRGSVTGSALLAIGVGAGLAGGVQALTGDVLPGAAAFLFGQILVGLGLVRTFDGSWRLQDMRLVFVGVFGLYGIMAALAAMAGGEAAPPQLAAATFLYGTGLLGFNAVQAIGATRWEDVPADTFGRYRATLVNYGLIVAVVAFVFAYAASRGVAFAATIDRRQSALLGTQLWVVTVLIANGVMMYMIAAWDNLPGVGRLVTVGSVLGFVLLQVMLGNRRDYLFLALFALARAATRRRATLGFRSGLAVAGGFAAFILLGVVRQLLLDPRLALQSPFLVALRANEFVFPIQTLVYYLDVGAPLRWGVTYVSWPSLFVPRALWPGKPESLAVQFLFDAFGTSDWQGYAYTPVTEAYLNFGWVGPLVSLSLAGLVVLWLVRGAPSHPIRYLIAYAVVVDFNRGDVAATMYSVVLIGAGFLLQQRVATLFAPRHRAVAPDSPVLPARA